MKEVEIKIDRETRFHQLGESSSGCFFVMLVVVMVKRLGSTFFNISVFHCSSRSHTEKINLSSIDYSPSQTIDPI